MAQQLPPEGGSLLVQGSSNNLWRLDLSCNLISEQPKPSTTKLSALVLYLMNPFFSPHQLVNVYERRNGICTMTKLCVYGMCIGSSFVL